MDAYSLGIAEHAADDQDRPQVQRHEVALAFGMPFGQETRINIRIAGVGVFAAQGAQARHIGDGLNVKHQN